MTRTPLPPVITREPCDPCKQLRGTVKLLRQLLAAAASEAGGVKFLTPSNEEPDIVPTNSGAWKITNVGN